MAFLVEDLGHGGPQLGTYVGFLAGCFCMSQLFSIMLWAKAADIYGRRPILFLGTLGTGVGMMVFGLARTYTQAVIGRLLSGLLCGNLGVLKAYITEVTDKSNRGGGFAILSIAWSVGTIFSPLIGGLLAKPCELYPQTFAAGTWQGELFAYYPYALPSIVCCTVNIITAALVFFYLKETRPPSSASQREENAGGESGSYAALPNSSRHGHNHHKQSHSNNKLPDPMQLHAVNTAHTLSERDEDMSENETNAFEMTAVTGAANKQNDPISENNMKTKGNNVVQSMIVDEIIGTKVTAVHDRPAVTTDTLAASGRARRSSLTKAYTPLWKRPIVLYAVGSYGVLCFAQIIFDETLPLYFKLAVDKGGFGLSSERIGELLSLAGFIFAGFTIGVLPIVANYSKPKLLAFGCSLGIPAAFIFPLMPRLLQHYPSGEWPLLVSGLLLKNISACLAFTAVTVQVNQSVADSELTTVNAFGQMIAALTRAAGPALGGTLWSAFLLVDSVYGNFAVVATFYFFTILVNRRLVCLLKLRSQDTSRCVAGKATGSAESDGGMMVMH